MTVAADQKCCSQIWVVAEIAAEVVEVFNSLRLSVVLLVAVRYWDSIGS